MYKDPAITPNRTSWAKSVRHLVQSIRLNNVWMNQGVGNVNLLIRILKERLNDNFIQNWNSELIESSRARTYVMFCNFRQQPYLTCITLEITVSFKNVFTYIKS